MSKSMLKLERYLPKKDRGIFSCECGNTKELSIRDVKRGKIKSCGCLTHRKKPNARKRMREYGIWNGMKKRCFNKNASNYKYYGGKGITVCDRWMDFDNFIEDMGQSKSFESIERISSDKNYDPSNCVWATKKQQANNTSSNRFITWEDITQTIAMWADTLEVNKSSLYSRFNRGMTVEQALFGKRRLSSRGKKNGQN